MKAWTLALLLALAVGAATASDAVIERRTEREYPEAMARLQDAVSAAGYRVRFVQPVDQGLKSRGVAADTLRVVLFDRPADVERLALDHPTLLALLPLRVALYEDDGALHLVTQRPSAMTADPQTRAIEDLLARWERDLETILAAVD